MHELEPRGANVRAEMRREEGERECSVRMNHLTFMLCIGSNRCMLTAHHKYVQMLVRV